MCRDSGRDLAGILPDEHEDRPQDDLAPILRGGTVTQFATETDLRDLAQAQRHATAYGDDDLTDISDTPELSGNANEILLSIALDVARADVLVIPGERLHDILQRDSVGAKLIRPRRHVELLLEAADGVHLGHAPEVAQLRAHHPVLELTQVRRSPFLAVGAFRPGLGLDRIHEDLAETGRDRPHGRLDFGR